MTREEAEQMLREEIEKYTKLTGVDGWHVPIIKVGAYLDGYDKGVEVLDKIIAEIRKGKYAEKKGLSERELIYANGWEDGLEVAISIIDKYLRQEIEE